MLPSYHPYQNTSLLLICRKKSSSPESSESTAGTT